MVRTVKVACIGDSLTEGGYPRVLQELLNAREPSCEWSVLNLGFLGADTKEWLQTNLASSKVRKVAEAGVDIYCVMLGTNDAQVQAFFNEQQYRERLTQLGRTLMNEGAPVILISPPPVEPGASFTQYIDVRIANTVLPRIVPEIANGLGCGFADAFAALGGAMPKHEALIDGVHLTPEGNRLVANAVLNPVLHTVMRKGGGNLPNPPLLPFVAGTARVLNKAADNARWTCAKCDEPNRPERADCNNCGAGRALASSRVPASMQCSVSPANGSVSPAARMISPFSSPDRRSCYRDVDAQPVLRPSQSCLRNREPARAIVLSASPNLAAEAATSPQHGPVSPRQLAVAAPLSPTRMRKKPDINNDLSPWPSPMAPQRGVAEAAPMPAPVAAATAAATQPSLVVPELQGPADVFSMVPPAICSPRAAASPMVPPAAAPTTSGSKTPLRQQSQFDALIPNYLPQTAQTPRPPQSSGYSVGAPVEVYSETSDAWFLGRIAKAQGIQILTDFVASDGKEKEKWMPIGHPHMRLVGQPVSPVVQATSAMNVAGAVSIPRSPPNGAGPWVQVPSLQPSPMGGASLSLRMPTSPPPCAGLSPVPAGLSPVLARGNGVVRQQSCNKPSPIPPAFNQQAAHLARSDSRYPNAAWPPQSSGYSVGAPVEVYSKTWDAWFLGRIAKAEGIQILTEFVASDGKEKEKWMPIGHPQMRLVGQPVSPVVQAAHLARTDSRSPKAAWGDCRAGNKAQMPPMPMQRFIHL